MQRFFDGRGFDALSIGSILALGSTAFAEPDLTVSALTGVTRFGAVSGVHSYALGFEGCNIGSTPVEWNGNTNRHPVLGSQLYRLSNGRFEQIGLSFLFNEFFPLQLNTCGDCMPPVDIRTLGAGCSSVNSGAIAGAQGGLARRTDVDPTTGEFDYPFAGINETGNAVFKRLQVNESDVAMPGARFFFEGLYIAPDDAEAGNGNNNASYREAIINPMTLEASLVGNTFDQLPAIYAWAEADDQVQIAEAEAADGGRYIVASRAQPLDSDGWRYEYAVFNQNASLNAIAFEAAYPGQSDFQQVWDLGFHDVDYHSGDPVDNTDWAGQTQVFSVRWEAQPPSQISIEQNNLRWGTLYNFGFSSINSPVQSMVRVELDDGPSLFIPAVTAGEARCGVGDFAEPFFVLDLADLSTYINLFLSNSAEADIREPFSVLDLADLQAFIGGFLGGCD